ncbi:MAG TPA: radical SAM protein, partial [Thermodesulfovibrionales bacterium]|nr:radical SAM protein [Thermodesulfovibrionales bacterium]
EQFGVEYMGVDYVFASLLFQESYERSKHLFRERLGSMGLTLDDFETMRGVVKNFADSAFTRLSPYLKDAKLIGFSCSHYQLSGSLLLCSWIKKTYPHVHTVFGGKDCSGALAYDIMRNMDCVDYIGFSECEVTIEALLKHLDDGASELCNLIYRDRDGVIRRSASKPNMSVNSLPFPEYDFGEFPLTMQEIILPIEFGRGCPWKRCTFCPDESYNIKCQTKTAERLVEEFEHYRGISGDLSNFFILDSDALKDKRVILDVSRYLDGKQLKFHYAEFRAERMDREVLDAILHFGEWVSNFQIGVESFSDSILKLMNKGVTVLKNVEVIKSVAEMGVPLQFNLFTCYPGMTYDHFAENMRVLDMIAHLLLSGNIQIFPGEFYLPTDCEVFMHPEQYGIQKQSENIFSFIFEEFPFPSYSNYPYPYLFGNDEEQFRMSEAIRKKVEEIKGKSKEDTFMVCETAEGGLKITVGRDGRKSELFLEHSAAEVYLSAMETIQTIDGVSKKLGIPAESVASLIDSFEKEGLALLSPDRRSFLSLATQSLFSAQSKHT